MCDEHDFCCCQKWSLDNFNHSEVLFFYVEVFLWIFIKHGDHDLTGIFEILKVWNRELILLAVG